MLGSGSNKVEKMKNKKQNGFDDMKKENNRKLKKPTRGKREEYFD